MNRDGMNSSAATVCFCEMERDHPGRPAGRSAEPFPEHPVLSPMSVFQ